MTVTQKASRKLISGAGWVNPLTHDFMLEATTHLKVYADQQLLVLGVDYSIGGLLNPAGYTVTITVPGSWTPTNWVLSVEQPIEQLNDVSLGGTYGARFEEALDTLTRRVQSIYDIAKRSLKLSKDTAVGTDMALKPRGGYVLAWKADGLGLESVPFAPGDINAAIAATAASAAAAAVARTNAELAETNAELAEVNAELAETNAETAAVASAAARDASFALGPKYADVATGNAAVANGAVFLVVGSGDVAAYEYRRVSAGVSTFLTSYPSAALTQELAERTAVEKLSHADLALSFRASTVGTSLAVVWLGLGQSNNEARAYDGGEVVMNYAVPMAKMPDGGYRANAIADTSANRQAFTAAGSNFDTLIPYVATASLGSKMDGIAAASDEPCSLFTDALGARDYTELRRGQGIYTTGIGAIKGMCAAWRALGYEAEVKITQLHGEAEADFLAAGGGAGSPTSYADYRKFLSEWLDHVRRDAQWAMLRPLYQAPLFGMGISYTGTEEYKQIIAAQTDFWLETDGCYHCGPVYQYAMDTDRVHSPGGACVLQGEMIKKVADYVAAGENWKPLHMRPFRRSGATVTIPCHVPRGNLTLDTTLVTDPSNLHGGLGKNGLQYFYGGVEKTISTVTISGNNLIVVLSADPGVAAVEEVRYALQTVAAGTQAVPANLARGNFRDEDEVYSRHVPGTILYNWMVAQIVELAA